MVSIMAKDSTHFVYILECSDKTYYIGRTNNIIKRLKAHNGLIGGGSRYTRARRPVYLIYLEEVADLSTALKREYALKLLTREEKEAFISLSSRVASG